METNKIELKLLRSFGIGITILSPKYNGFCIAIQLTVLEITIWSRGKGWFGFNSYWNYD